jgi:octaprenyl-diphosphate synthase
MEEGDLHDGDLERAIAILRRHGAIEATTARATRFAEEAHQALSIYPEGEMRRALAQAVDFAVERSR